MPDPSSVTFGMEEEFVLLDQQTLTAAGEAGAEAAAALRNAGPGLVSEEFHPSQIEFATPVCRHVGEALEAITTFRATLARWASDRGLLAAATGTPFRTTGPEPVRSGRYARIADDIAGLAADHQLNGLHVHVGITDREAGIRAANALRPWLPVLLAVSANSPFWQGKDTGFASWRVIHGRRWTVQGIPPFFPDAAAYDDAIDRLRGVGATSDAGTVNWHVRLSATHPTLEIRVCDAQLDPSAAAALAVLVRALVVAGIEEGVSPPARYEAWDAALWHAARWGTGGTLVDPHSGRPVRAATVVDGLRRRAEPWLASDDHRVVEGFFADLSRRGNGAAQQRAAHARGRLPDLLRTRLWGRGGREPLTTRAPAVPAPRSADSAALP